MSAPFLLFYDIPDVAKIANPTHWLLPIAVRLNKSVWVIQEDYIPYRQLENLERAGATWHTLQFDTRAMGDIVELVTRSLTKEIQSVVQRSNDSCNKISEAAGKSKKPILDRIKSHRKKVTPVIRKMGRKLQAIRKAARSFGVTPDQIAYGQAESSMEGLRQAMLERGRVMLEAARELELRTPRDPMAKAVRYGGVPADILADYLQDRDMPEAEKVKAVARFW